MGENAPGTRFRGRIQFTSTIERNNPARSHTAKLQQGRVPSHKPILSSHFSLNQPESALSPTELVRGIYAAFAREDLQSIYDHCAPDILWTSYGPQRWATNAMFTGVDGVKRYFDLNGKLLNATVFMPGQTYSDGDAVIVQGYENGTMAATGVPMESYWTHIWVVRAGLVTRFTEYLGNLVHYPVIAPSSKAPSAQAKK